jgi:hypothetical protein
VRKEKIFFDGGKNMKRALVILVFLLLATPLWAAEVGLNISLGAPGFYLSVSNFYGYPERQVIVIHERGIPDDDIPVVFFISKHAHVAPEVIIKLRVVDGWAWSRICAYYRIPLTVFYIPVARYGPPYGRAYGYYKRYPHERDWGRIRLKDADIVNQVNLIFISKYYNYSPERVIKMREQGSSFGNIERKVYREREYQARGGVPPQEMRGPASPPEMRRPQGRTEGMAGSPSRKDIPSQGVRPPHTRFQDVYPSIPHPSQRPEVKGGYDGEEKGRARGRGKKD